jgi:hypothetical protein
MNKVLKIGDEVIWKGGFGMDKPKVAKVEGIELTRGGKYGDPVDEIEWSEVYDRNVCVDLDNGHWAYGSQIKQKK